MALKRLGARELGRMYQAPETWIIPKRKIGKSPNHPFFKRQTVSLFLGGYSFASLRVMTFNLVVFRRI